MWIIPEFFKDVSGTIQVNRVKGPQIPRYDIGLFHSWSSDITILEYINEIIDAFDKSDPMGVGTDSSAAPDILF